MTLKRNTAGDGQQACCILWGEAQSMREQSRQHPGREHTPLEEASGDDKQHGGGWRRVQGRHMVEQTVTTTCRTNTQSITAMSSMFSTIIRRATPSLRQQARPRTAGAAHTQTAAASSSSSSSPSKLDVSEQAIYDKLSERFQTSELLVQDVSGAPPSWPYPWTTLSYIHVLFSL